MTYQVNTMSVDSSSLTTLPNFNTTRRRILNRRPDNKNNNDQQPLPQLPNTPTSTPGCSQTFLLSQIPLAPAAAPLGLNSSPSSIQWATSPATLLNSDKNAVGCLRGVVACLDIHTEDGANVSANFEQDLKNMGAKTRKTFADTVTHLIFKNGSSQNLKKALQNKNCKIVNLLWITDCKVHGKHLSEDKYLIDRPENLVLSASKRRKCMEPGQVKALKLGDSIDTSDKRPSTIANPSYHPTTKRSKLFISQSPSSFNVNTKRKPSAIISKETTSSHHSESDRCTAQQNLATLGMDLQLEHHEHSTGIESETLMMDKSMLLKSMRALNTNNQHNHPNRSFTPSPQRPQVNQTIKAGFYIKSKPHSSSSPSSVQQNLAAMTTLKAPGAIRRRRRQSTTVSSTDTHPFVFVRPSSSPTRMSDTPQMTQIPSASNSTDLLRPKKNTIPTIVLTSMPTKQKKVCTSIIEKLGKYQLATTVDESTTHVIVGCQRRTQSVVLGLAYGIWIVTPAWLLISDKSNSYLDEVDYEATQFFPRAKAARQQDPLLPSTISIHIHSSSMPKDLVKQLVMKGGGQTVDRLHDADIVISNTLLDCDCVATIVTDSWLLDSIEQWRYLPTNSYIPSHD